MAPSDQEGIHNSISIHDGYDFYIIGAESYSLGHSSMSHFIYTHEVGGQGGYIQNIKKGSMLKIYCTSTFQNDCRIICHVDGNYFFSVQG